MDGVSRETGQAELPLAQSGLAAGLSVEQEERLRKYLERVELADGEVLFRNGEPGDSLFLVARGSVSIRVPQAASEHSPRLAAFGPGIVLGEMAVIEGKPRSADAIADEPSVLYRLDRRHFDRLCAEDPALGARLLMQISIELAGRLRTTTLSLRELSLQ
jgi:CRP-like cAMP-binding protein